MDANRKSVRWRPNTRVIMAILVFSTIGLCLSSKDNGTRGISDFMKFRSLRGILNGRFDPSYVWNGFHNEIAFHRKLLARFNNPYTKLAGKNRPLAAPEEATPSPSPSPSPMPTPTPSAKPPATPRPSPLPLPSLEPSTDEPSSEEPSLEEPEIERSSSNSIVGIVAGSVGGVLFALILAVGMCLFKSKAVKSVAPWRTGLSGQLQKAFVTGIPTLKRSELEAACEDFSNIIGSSAIGTLFKGTLSSGLEIAVASVAAKSSKDWSNSKEMRFRKKIESLSKVNHKNFVNLIGYCKENHPFSRMMVFEYAPNGTLYELLHVEGSENLDWKTRLRIAMGIAYCLDHMHQLHKPLAHGNLISSSIYLTEDYAAKVADFSLFQDDAKKTLGGSCPYPTPKNNVYSFGVLLFEIVTGKMLFPPPYTAEEEFESALGSPLVPPAGSSPECPDEEKIEEIREVIRDCVHPDPKKRPSMREISERLREITGISPAAATPRLSPLWWAELEMMSPA